MVGKENQMHRYATEGHGSQDYKEQIPGGLSQQTMTGPTIGLNVTTDVQNQVTKIENQKSLHYFSDAASRLGGTQCANRWHRCDPHRKEGWIECLFGLQCLQLAEIMGYQWAGTIMGWLLKNIVTFQPVQKAD
jgi:hypothetical protein